LVAAGLFFSVILVDVAEIQHVQECYGKPVEAPAETEDFTGDPFQGDPIKYRRDVPEVSWRIIGWFSGSLLGYWAVCLALWISASEQFSLGVGGCIVLAAVGLGGLQRHNMRMSTLLPGLLWDYDVRITCAIVSGAVLLATPLSAVNLTIVVITGARLIIAGTFEVASVYSDYRYLRRLATIDALLGAPEILREFIAFSNKKQIAENINYMLDVLQMLAAPSEESTRRGYVIMQIYLGQMRLNTSSLGLGSQPSSKSPTPSSSTEPLPKPSDSPRLPRSGSAFWRKRRRNSDPSVKPPSMLTTPTAALPEIICLLGPSIEAFLINEGLRDVQNSPQRSRLAMLGNILTGSETVIAACDSGNSPETNV